MEPLPDDLLVHRILPYFSHRKDLGQLSMVSHRLRRLLCSSLASDIWTLTDNNHPFKVCIDDYCPTCHFYERGKKVTRSAFRFLATFPIQNLTMHCFVTDIPKCLLALAENSTLQRLDLSLTNKSSSLPLDVLLSEEAMRLLPNNAFYQLRYLTLDSSHLNHVILAGRARVLDILGRRLQALQFLNLSPSGVFSILAERCPHLTFLRVDRAQTLSDLETYRNDQLHELELCRCGFIPPPLPFPLLSRLKFSATFRLEEVQVKSAIKAIPNAVQELEFEVPSNFVHLALHYIGKYLPRLRRLTLIGSHEKGTIQSEVLRAFGRKCLELEYLEIVSDRSVTALLIEDTALLVLRTDFPSLHRVRLMFHADLITVLPSFMSAPGPVRQVVLWAKQHWMTQEEWLSRSTFLSNLSSHFQENGVMAILQDSS